MKKNKAIIISYINMALNFPINIILMPMLIDSLTDNYYSIYRIVQSFAGPLMLFNLGVSTIVTREIVSCNTNDSVSVNTKQNNMALSMIASAFMSFIVMIVGFGMRQIIPSIYGNNFTPGDIRIGQTVFTIFTISVIFHILTDAFTGIILGHRGYTYHAIISLSRTVLKAALIIICVKLGMGIIAIACVDLILSLVAFLLSVVYSFAIAKERPKLYHWDKKKIIEIFSYAFAILLQGIVTQINNSVDTMVLGAMVAEKYIITMYSCSLTIYSIYNSLVSMISSYFLPDAISLVNKNADGKELTDFVIRPGRFQSMLAVAILCVFGVNGSQFINLWIGAKYSDAYFVTLILIIPVTIPLVENVVITILDATLKRKYRSIILFLMAMINFGLTIVLVKIIGFWGAAIATAFSLIVGHGFLMNTYYKKQFKMEIGRMFFSIFHKILLCGLVSGVIMYFANKFFINAVLHQGWFSFIISCAIQLIVYLLLLYFYGMNPEEKGFVNRVLKRR